MDIHQLSRELHTKNETKIVMYVADGLGGLPQQPGGLTELETANTPNLDALAKAGVLGSSIPVCPGISPGSGPGHLGLFGYDPLQYEVGRGVIEALGLGMELKAGDIEARANFCTLDGKGIVTDRRAARIETKISEELCAWLSKNIKK